MYTPNGELHLLDAKYRDLWSKSLPAEMLYQLTIYALSQEGKGRATILYPTLETDAKVAVVCIRAPHSSAVRAEVILRPINMVRLAALVAVPSSPQIERRKHEEALKWIAPPGQEGTTPLPN